jgi:hypothetical protein
MAMSASSYKKVVRKVMSALMLAPAEVPGLSGWRNAAR